MAASDAELAVGSVILAGRRRVQRDSLVTDLQRHDNGEHARR